MHIKMVRKNGGDNFAQVFKWSLFVAKIITTQTEWWL